MAERGTFHQHKPNVNMKNAIRTVNLAIGVVFILFMTVNGVGVAQSPAAWSPAKNLSQSGAASQPRLVATPRGELQAFWWDRFDGLMSATGQTGEESGEVFWSQPIQASIPSAEIESTPAIIVDAFGWVHAFWSEANEDASSPSSASAGAGLIETRLMHSEMPLGSVQWSFPETVAESMIGYAATAPKTGGITVAYIRNKHTSDAPAGIYVKHHYGADRGWGLPSVVYSSIYLRLISPEQARIHLLDDAKTELEGSHPLYLTWYDPRQEKIMFSASGNSGSTWSQVQAFGASEEQPVDPRLTHNGKPLLIWQASAQGGCALYQQESLENSQITDNTVIEWGPQEQILADLTECPQRDRFLNQGEHLIWLWNEGSQNVTMTIWDSEQSSWSQTFNVNFAFEDTDTQKSVTLDGLQATISEDKIFAIGNDVAAGEIWFTQANIDTLKLTFTTESSWMPAERVSTKGLYASIPALASDQQEQTHLVWSQGAKPSSLSNSLYYAKYASGSLSGPFEILPASINEIARQPSMLYDASNDSIHLAWSGGEDGAILYSWSNTREASSPTGWAAPQSISQAGAASWPQIGQDGRGRLYVLYVISINESRGVYLVRSEDRGKTWSPPVDVFNATAARWPMVDHPTLAVRHDGALYAAWVESQAPGIDHDLGIHYSVSLDGGDTWFTPISLTGAGYDWPRLIVSGGKIHLLYASSDNGSGSLYHRWAEISQPTENSSSWSIPVSIPDWRNIALPFGVAASGPADQSVQETIGTIHLVGADPNTGALRYSKWEGQRWSNYEEFRGDKQIEKGLGISAFAPPGGGTLAVGWLALPSETQQDQKESVFFTSRAIPSVEILAPENVFVEPTETPASTSTVTPAPTPAATPTPILSLAAPTRSPPLPVHPLILGAGLAALAISSIFGARLIFNRITRRTH